MLLSSSALLLLVPLVLAELPFTDEYLRACGDAEKFNPFQDGDVFKKCIFSAEDGGKVEVVGCLEPMRSSMIPIGQELPVPKWKAIMDLISFEDKTDVCEFKDGQWQWRRSSRPSQAQLDFLEANPICERNGFQHQFLDGNNYKKCSFNNKKGFSLEIVACKAIAGRTPLAVGEERRDNKREDVETCTLKDGEVIYEHRPMTEDEIHLKDATLALCREHGFSNAFARGDTYQRCVGNGRGLVNTIIVGCVSKEQKGALIPLDSRFESDEGVVEVCQATLSKEGVVIGVTLKSNRKEIATTTPEPVPVEVSDAESEESSTVPSCSNVFTKAETDAYCFTYGLDHYFTINATAVYYCESKEGALAIELLGCWSPERVVVPVGETVENWKCTVNSEGKAELLPVVSSTASPVEPPTDPALIDTVFKTLDKCDDEGLEVVFFEGNAAKKCTLATENDEHHIGIVTVGCRFAASDKVIAIGDAYDKWDVKFRCVAKEDGGVHLVIEEAATSSPPPPPSISDDEYVETLIKCQENGIDVVFFEGNVAKKCIMAPENDYRIVLIETVGCRSFVSDAVIALGDVDDSFGIKFRCVAKEDGGAQLVFEKSSEPSTTEVVPPETEAKHPKQPHCAFNGHVVPFKSRVIIGGRFEFVCSRVSYGKREHSKGIRRTELRFFGCVKSNDEKSLKRRHRNLSHVTCDLSSMDPTMIEVIN